MNIPFLSNPSLPSEPFLDKVDRFRQRELFECETFSHSALNIVHPGLESVVLKIQGDILKHDISSLAIRLDQEYVWQYICVCDESKVLSI